MNPEPIPTPLTDAEEYEVEVNGGTQWDKVVRPDFARTLERQTAEQAATIDRLREALTDLLSAVCAMDGEECDYPMALVNACRRGEEALSSAPAVIQDSLTVEGWRPITDEIKDGRHVIIAQGLWVGVAWWKNFEDQFKGESGWYDAVGWVGKVVDGWQPVPPPPAKQEVVS